MQNKWKFRIFLLIFTTLMLVQFSCKKADEVVVYTSVDRNFSEPVLKEFQKETGIKVRALYDVEASKTVGLVNRLIAEKTKPRADVFWNGEIIQTLKLKEEGVLDPYISKNAQDLPENFKDEEGYWTAFGGRARIIIVNINRISESDYPKSIFDFINGRYAGEEMGIAMPLFGTTATQAAVLYALWGRDRARNFYKDIYEKNVVILNGNSAVRDFVADGKLSFGMTDTDDALGAINRGEQVKVIFPDQGDKGMGVLVIPNSIALIKGAPNKENGELLIDYLLRKKTMIELIRIGWCQVSLRNIGLKSPVWHEDVKVMKVDWKEVSKQVDTANKDLREIFSR